MPAAAPLRILQFNSLLTGGGTDDQSLRLSRGLMNEGQEVWLAAPEDRELSQLARSLDLRLLPPPAGAGKLTKIRAVAEACRRHQVDILHAHHGRDYWPAILAARMARPRPRLILTRHLAKSPASWASRHFLLSQCAALIAVSHFVARVLRDGVFEPRSPVAERRARPPLRGDHDRIRVVHGGIDVERFQPGDASAQRQAWGLAPHHIAFGVVGGYDLPRGKGQREFLLAASQISESVPNARFLVIGRGNLAETLRADINRLGLEGRAWLTDYVHDMPQAMNALDCLVHPQVATDAFPTVILEAMACNKPIIATRCDGAPEQFIEGEHGLLVPMEDVPTLGHAMQQLATNHGLRQHLGLKGRQHVSEHFTLELMARRVLEVYREILPDTA